MEIRVYKTGEEKKIDIRNSSINQVISSTQYKEAFAAIETRNKLFLSVEGERIIENADFSIFKDFSGNDLSTTPSGTADAINAILASNREVDSYVIGDDLSQKSSETIFTHNKAGTSGLGGRLVVDNEEAKLDITRSTGQGETSVTVSAEDLAGADRGTITGKVAFSNGTQDAFTVQGGNPGLGAPQFTINGRLIAENGIYVGSGGGTELAITDLDKVPTSLGSTGQVLAVNSAGTSLEFVNQSGGSGSGSSTLLGLTDTPSGFGSTGQVLVVNAGRTAMEFATPLQLGTTSTTALAGNTVTITTSQALAITANSAKTSFPGFGITAGTALEGNTSLFDGAYSSLTGIPSSFTPSAHNQAWTTITGTPTTISGYGITDALQLGTTSTTALAGDTTTITSAQASAITANTAKTSFPGFGTTAGTALEGNTSLFDGAYSSLTGTPTIPSDITDLGDTPASLGTSGQVLAVNSGGTALEFVDQSGGGGTQQTLEGELIDFVTRSTSYDQTAYEGEVVKIGSGSSMSFGQLRYMSAAGTPLTARWVNADADAESTSSGMLAIALGSNALTDGMLVRGSITHSNTFTPGDILYVSLTAGEITNDISSFTTGDIVRIVGYAMSTAQIYFNPSPNFIELA